MGLPGPVQFDVKNSKNVTMVVTTQDGKKYEVEMAVLVVQVTDSGITNPLDGMPMFTIGTQIVSQVREHAGGK